MVAMNQLGYSPNSAARALRRGRFSALGVITQRFDRTGETLTAASVIKAAEALQYATTLVQVSGLETENLSQASHRLSHHAIDGLIIIRVGPVSKDALSLPVGLPVVVSDSQLLDLYPSVVTDHEAGSRAVVEHLLELGHKNIYHVAGAKDSSPATFRQKAWFERLREAGISPMPVWQGDWTAQSGYEAGLHIARQRQISAVYCANDEMAFGVLRALQEQGFRVPEDISVVGFDAISLSEYSSPPLTTVSPGYDTIGAELVRLLVEQIDHGELESTTQIVVPSKLIVRGSTARAPLR